MADIKNSYSIKATNPKTKEEHDFGVVHNKTRDEIVKHVDHLNHYYKYPIRASERKFQNHVFSASLKV